MKHGILMMAHNNTEVVKTCLRMLDDERFTLFLLVDAKSPLKPEDFLPELEHMRCVVLPRISINWGGYSLVQGMLNQIRAAVDARMDVLHVLQGADLPLKTPEEIDRFFTERKGKNFLRYEPWQEYMAPYRAFCRHYLIDTPYYRHNQFLHIINHLLARSQKLFVDMNRPVWIGSSLVSLSREFAAYLVEMEDQIRKDYRYALAGDEIFMHTIIKQSPFADTLYRPQKGIRLIDWERREGRSPRTFDMSDLEILRAAVENEELMFARKFQKSRDIEIVKAVERMVTARR